MIYSSARVGRYGRPHVKMYATHHCVCYPPHKYYTDQFGLWHCTYVYQGKYHSQSASCKRWRVGSQYVPKQLVWVGVITRHLKWESMLWHMAPTSQLPTGHTVPTSIVPLMFLEFYRAVLAFHMSLEVGSFFLRIRKVSFPLLGYLVSHPR